MSTRARTFNTFVNVQSIEHANNWWKKYIEENNAVRWARAQVENTENGQLHIQIVFNYENARLLSTVQKFFKNMNIQITDDVEAMVMYCTKDEKRVFGTNIYIKGEMQFHHSQESKEQWYDEALATGNYEDAMNLMFSKSRQYYAMNQKKLSSFFRERFPVQCEIKYSLDDFTEPRIDQALFEDRAVVVVGPSRIGKTSFVKAHFKKPAVMSSKSDYQNINSETDAYIFDDMVTKNWQTKTLSNLLDIEKTTFQDIKYGTVQLKEGIPRVFTINNEDEFWPKELFSTNGELLPNEEENFNAIDERVHFVHYSKPLMKERKRKLPYERPSQSRKRFNISNMSNISGDS